MKAFVITLMFCLGSLTTLAADTTIIKLMQKVIATEVPSYYHYYYLIDKAENPKLAKYYDVDLTWAHNEPVTKLPWDDFEKTIKADTTSFNWLPYNLSRARCINKNHTSKHNPFVRMTRLMPSDTSRRVIDSLEAKDIVVVLVKKGATRKQIDLAEKKALAKFNAKWSVESYSVFIISKPVFSDDKQFAIISVELNGGGCSYVFRNKNGRWAEIARFSCKVV